MGAPVSGGSLAEHLVGWDPAPVRTEDPLPAEPAVRLARTLGEHPPVVGPGDPLPPLWHLLYFLDWPPQRDLGPDGHLRAGGFLPPIPDRRRMFGGGRLVVHGPLRCGEPARRCARLVDRNVKHGRSGELVFVTVRHEISQGGTLRVAEEQDLVYRRGDAPASAAQRPGSDGRAVSAQAAWQLPFHADPVLLFRFSALTANAHRIHYDQSYAASEGFADLVVHAPLLALLLLELPRRFAPERRLTTFAYRARRPVLLGEQVLLTGEPSDDGSCRLAVLGSGGAAMTGDAVLT